MADAHSDYTKGEMAVGAQQGTFSGFMGMTIYGGGLLALALLFPILTVGGGGLPWLTALIATVVAGIVMGVLLKLKGAWYATIILVAGIVGVICAIVSALT